MVKQDIMRTLILITISFYFLASSYAQKHIENQEMTTLGLTYHNQSYHHLEEYQLASPELQFRQQMRLHSVLITATTRHLMERFTILKGSSLALSYRPLHAYRDHWLEAGLVFSYDKQNPNISESGKLTGWTGTVAAHRRVNDWYVHEGRISTGYYHGYAIGQEMPSQPRFIYPEIPQEAFSFVRFAINYTGEAQLPFLSFGTRVDFRKSSYNKETMLSLYVKKSLDLTSGQRLEIDAGITSINARHSSRAEDLGLAADPRRSARAATESAEPILNPLQMYLGVKMFFLRGKKLRAF